MRIFLVLLFFVPFLASASDFDLAFPSFTYKNQKAVPMDFQTVDYNLTFDYSKQSAVGYAKIEFGTAEDGYPVFDMVMDPSSLKLNGNLLSNAILETTPDPDGVTNVRVLALPVKAGTTNVLEIWYAFTNKVTFSSGNVRTGFFMSDLAYGGREFLEQYAPSSFENDHYQANMEVSILGAAKEHVIYTNAAQTKTGNNSWSLKFPAYFTTSSFYFHLAEKGRFYETNFTIQGIEKDIDVTIYSATQSYLASATTKTKSVIAENEATYGAFAHDRAVIYMVPGGGGMEHCGATMTEPSALGHELTHSWFARGVMPANGNAGWIDEAMASWRDDAYPRSASDPSSSSVNLSGFSPYRRHTPDEAYTEGKRLISKFDEMFKNMFGDNVTGMRWIMRNFFGQYKRQSVSVETFKTFLESFTGKDLSAIFKRFVFGDSVFDSSFENLAIKKIVPQPKSSHPRKFTAEELLLFR